MFVFGGLYEQAHIHNYIHANVLNCCLTVFVSTIERNSKKAAKHQFKTFA